MVSYKQQIDIQTIPEKRLNTIRYFPVYGLYMPIYGSKNRQTHVRNYKRLVFFTDVASLWSSNILTPFSLTSVEGCYNVCYHLLVGLPLYPEPCVFTGMVGNKLHQSAIFLCFQCSYRDRNKKYVKGRTLYGGWYDVKTLKRRLSDVMCRLGNPNFQNCLFIFDCIALHMPIRSSWAFADRVPKNIRRSRIFLSRLN